MTIDNLSGRELDASVAQGIFELHVEERENTKTGAKDAVCRAPGMEWVRVAYYSASVGTSLNVQLAIQNRGWKWVDPRPRGSGEVRVVLEHADGRVVEASGPVNEALCPAALKAVVS